MFTPNKTGGISKTLLTPCRRLGLTRKVVKNQTNKLSEIGNSTPIVEKKCIKNDLNSLITCGIKNASKEDLNVSGLEPLKQIEKLDGNISENVKVKKKSHSKPLDCNYASKINKDSKIKSKMTSKDKLIEVTDSLQENVENKVQIKNCSPTALMKENIIINDEDFQSNPCDVYKKDLLSKGNDKKYNKKSFTKRLSMKRNSSSSQGESTDVDDDFKNSPVLCFNSSQEPNESVLQQCSVRIKKLPTEMRNKVEESKSKRKKKVIYSSDEDDFVPSQNSVKSEKQKTNYSEGDLQQKIIKLEEEIKLKKSKVETFKQAEIYQKLHDLKELEQLSRVWKEGCKSALTDLLVKLKEHGHMDMPTLLSNLKIPNTFINYNADNDTLLF